MPAHRFLFIGVRGRQRTMIVEPIFPARPIVVGREFEPTRATRACKDVSLASSNRAGTAGTDQCLRVVK